MKVIESNKGNPSKNGQTLQQTIANFNHHVTDEKLEKNLDSLKEGGSSADSCDFTVDDVVEHLGFGKFQIVLSIFAGFTWMADAMEVMILSILSPALACEWNITPVEEALITTCVFAGMLFSSTIWGSFCDRFGRRFGLVCISTSTFVFGAASAFAPNFYSFLALRTLTGVCIAGLPQSVTYYSEFLPISHRAKCIILMEVFWALGSIFESGIAVFVMQPLGWRWLLIISTLPLFISAVSCLFIPESPRFLMISGKRDEAYRTLECVGRLNGRSLPSGQLVESAEKGNNETRGSVLNLFSRQLFFTTLLVWLIWFFAAACYYGIILFTTVLFQSGDTCHGGITTDGNSTTSCKMLTHDDYIGFVFTSFSELPGIIITALLIEFLGRKRTMAFNFTIFSIFSLLLLLCVTRTYVTMFIFVARAFICGAFQVAYVYTPEVYPTTMRAVGLGSASGVARLGSLLTPFIAQVASKEFSLAVPPVVYGIGGILAVFASMFLPIETKGRKMMDRIGEYT